MYSMKEFAFNSSLVLPNGINHTRSLEMPNKALNPSTSSISCRGPMTNLKSTLLQWVRNCRTFGLIRRCVASPEFDNFGEQLIWSTQGSNSFVGIIVQL